MKYKETDIQWLGKIPEHWETTTIKNHFYVIPSNVDKKTKENEIPVELCNYVDVYYNDFIDLSVPFMEATANENEVVKFQLKEKDVLITKDSEDPLDIGVPALINEVKDKLLCGYHLSMLRPKSNKITGDYLFWLLKDTSIASQLWREATGVTRWAIASRHVKNSIIALPPKKEQIVIADYLDKACKRIDKVIKIKEEQIKTTESIKKSQVYKLCTKGLLDDVKLKEVDGQYIKKIPSHWNFGKLKRGCKSIDTGGTPKSSESAYFIDGTIKWYAPDCFEESMILTKPKKLINKIALDDNEIKLYPENSVYFVGVGATAGKVGIIKEPSSCNQQINILQTNYKLIPEFLFYHLKIIEKEIIRFAQYTTLPILNQSKTGYIEICYPPINEQTEIVDRLNKIFSNTQKTKTILKDQIKTLKNYRKSLIHECVTGKKQIVKVETTQSI